ncbi:MAG: phosphoglycerate mutase family protein [Azospirillaceae bacterium]|nr:phosphoglycerate mutase family protein [Azospirillaceae bacterium]
MVALYLIRHGQASFDADDYDRLSAVGLDQARVVGRALAARLPRVDAAVAGTLTRQRDTGATCLDAMGVRGAIPFTVDADLDEYDAADLIGRHRPDLADAATLRAELAATPDPRRAYQALFADAVARWMSGRYDHEYAEAWPVFRRRCLAAMTRAAVLGGTVLVFTSGGPIMAAVQAVVGLNGAPARQVHWGLVNGGVTKLLVPSKAAGRMGPDWSLASLNEHALLEAQPGLLTYR